MSHTGITRRAPALITWSLVLAIAAGVALWLGWPSTAHAAPLACSGSATNVVGAHAGSLSIRVGVTVQCDEAAHLEVVLPGGARGEFDTDDTGAFMGIAGDAYVCSAHPQPVAVLATTATGDEWQGLLTIEQEAGAPAGAGNPGMDCDVMLHPGFNYVTYDGPLAGPAQAFANGQFSAVLPFGTSDSLNGADHVMTVFEQVPGATPADWTWVQWRPLAPAIVSQLHLLVPGHTYVVQTDAELAWSFPPPTP